MSRTHRVALDCLTESTCTPRSESNLLSSSSVQHHDFLFSRSHFGSVEKATTMSKRIQERKTEEEPAVAKLRSVCLISTNLNREQSSSLDPDASIRNWIWGLCKGVAGNCSETETKTQQRVLRCGKKTNRLKGVAGNCSETLKSNWKRLGWTTIICKSHIIGTLRKSSRISVTSWIVSENDEMFDLKTNILIWGLFLCRQR